MSKHRDRFDDADNEITKKAKREKLILDQTLMGKRVMAGPVGSNLNTITPCAACKLLRRRCAEECPFSPYFSPHEPHKFAAVHKVFGASNVAKLLMEVAENQRGDAANSLVYEANLRLRDPVYGCMGAISALQQQVQSLHAQLNQVRAEIFKYYTEAAATSNIINPPSLLQVAVTSSANPPPPPPPPPLSSPSVIVSSSSSTSSNTSLFTRPKSNAAGYSSISSDHNVTFFD